jgi:hypothetical protein
MLVFSLHNSILLWCFYTTSLMDSAFGIIKNWRVKLFSIVSPYSFDFSIELSLNEGKERLY